MQHPTQRAFVIEERDHVATALGPLEPGEVEILGDCALRSLLAREDIPNGHKVAIAPVGAGEPVCKYGHAIGRASRDIQVGDWVHLHNLASHFDERSGTLDQGTGSPTDTLPAYE